jgi:hypothetical protein
MSQLPKRSDSIYQEIENFEDYEYTNCIAYEMNIRTDEFINITNRLKEKIKNNFDILITFNDFATKNGKIDYILFEKVSNIMDEIENLLIKTNTIYYEYHSNNNDVIKVASAFYLDYVEYLTFDYENFNNNELQVLDDEDDNKKSLLNENSTKYFYLANEYEIDKYEDNPYKKIKSHTTFLNPKYCRPGLLFESKCNLDLNINISLPEDELIDYIVKLKKEYSSIVNLIKSPIELLGAELDQAEEIKSKALPKDKEKRKKAMANAFYVYDMYKVLEQEYSIKTINLKLERDTQIKNIKQSKNYDRQEKNSIIQSVKEEYTFLLEQYSKTSIKIEINLHSGLSIDDIERYKALMNKYIDKLKYKELITGISN